MADPHSDPSGTVYGGARRTRRVRGVRLPQDPLMRIALGVGATGVLLGAFFATGVLGGSGERPVVPAAAVPTAAASEPSAEPTAEPTPSSSPSPSAAPTTPAAPVATPKVLRGVPSGRCLGVTGDEAEGAQAALADCTGGPEQQWVVTPVTNDTYLLVNAASSKCLDVNEAKTDDGADVQQWSCNGQANQQWRFQQAGDGAALLVAVHSGKCAQVDDAGTEPGRELEQAPCSGAPEQQWAAG
ncbi:RICIN domain-containing protein [Micromonospora sp. WMMA1947]|uniref:RICIN domain-containing protein n=1 Tax=Micromonospora sp. WMMA1947 TaxID=3015163 RepID=UPI00248B765D|nr:RICIN domain-containing protein [Micromonospora sp. WMMA1947]WBC10094.1 RICIN domain-containing protein [Micromonospora sp. WMMA1947]